jgi:hypothetical protein
MDSFLDLDALSRAIASYGLPPPDREPITVQDDSWRVLALLLSLRRLTGIALAAAEAGWLRVGDAAVEELIQRHREQMLHCLAIERSLLRVASNLDDAGVPFLVLKGPALAHGLYPDPSWRPFGDLDLLVRTEDWRLACDVVRSAGYRRDLPEPRSGFDVRFGKAATHTNEDGLQLDLHRTLTLGPFGLWLDPGELFEETVTFDLGGQTFRRLADTNLLLHACIHASLGSAPPLPVPVRDVAQILQSPNVDWQALGERAVRWRLIAVVRDALGVARRDCVIRLPAGAEPFVTAIPKRRELRALRSYQELRGSGGISLSTAMAIPSVRGRLEYARGLLFPTHEFMRARGDASASHLARWKIPLRWAAHRSHLAPPR